MALRCWFLVAVMAYVGHPGFASPCPDRSVCNDLSNKERILDCLLLCRPSLQDELPDLRAWSLEVNDYNGLLLSILLVKLVPDNKALESALEAHSARRRSYAMEHFRWGKPSGRKRRPIKVLTSSMEGGGSYESSYPPQARRQLNSHEDEAMGDLNGESHERQGSLRAKVSSKSHVQFSLQDRKHGTYRIDHFRWGRPHAVAKRNSKLKSLEGKPPRPVNKRITNNTAKDVRRTTGRMAGRGPGEIRVIETV